MIVADSSEIKKHIKTKTAVALGSFDALHQGHIRLIKMTADIARRRGYTSLVQLFRTPPGGLSINTTEKRLSILEGMGIDAVVLEDFNDDFKKTTYSEFVTEYIGKRYNAAVACAGYNYRFGHMAQGDTPMLEAECEKIGVEVYIQDCVRLDEAISSTLIREMVRKGDMEKAELYMGRGFALQGIVVKGWQLGREMGFPTANINLPCGIAVPAEGVYKTRVSIDGKSYPGITNIGGKPTVNVAERNCETHIIGFEGDLYGKVIEIEFCSRLRDIQRFDSIDGLKAQLERDLKKVLEKM